MNEKGSWWILHGDEKKVPARYSTWVHTLLARHPATPSMKKVILGPGTRSMDYTLRNLVRACQLKINLQLLLTASEHRL